MVGWVFQFHDSRINAEKDIYYILANRNYQTLNIEINHLTIEDGMSEQFMTISYFEELV